MGKDSSEIRREIEDTRARMGDTVEALSYKADVPARMKDAVNDRVEAVRGTIGDVVGSVKETVAGAGEALGSVLGETGAKAGTALGTARRGVAQTLGTTAERLGDATTTMNSLTSTVGNVAGTVADKLPDRQDVTDAARRGVGIAAENPLGLAIGAFAVGFLAGLAAPVTDLERQTVGPIRDDLLERAKSVGSDALEHGKQVLQETAQAALGAAQQSAQQHGSQVLSEAQGETVHGGNGQSQQQDASNEYGVLLDDQRG